MRWTRVALYSLAGLVVVLAIVISVAFTLDFGRYKSDAEVLVSDLLKREFAIDGHLSLTLGRSINLNAEDIRLASTEWSSADNIASIRKIELSVNTWSLLRGPIMIESLVVDGVRANLEQNASGENNWTFFEAGEKPEEEKVADRPRLPVLADDIRISDLILNYDNPERPRPLQFSATTIEEEIDVDGYIQLRVDGELNETPVTLNVSAGTVDDLVDFKNADIQLAGNLGEIALNGEAIIADLLRPSKPTVGLRIDGPNVEYLTDRLRLERITTGPLNLDLSVAPVNSLQHLNVHGEIGEFSIIVDGRYADLRQLDEVELSLSASGPDASTVMGLFGVEDVPQDPFNAIGKIIRSGEMLTVESMKLTIGPTQFDLSGRFDEFPNPNRANAQVRLNGPDISRFARLLGLPGRLEGPFDLAADLAALPGGGATVDMTANSNATALTVKGNITDAENFVGTDVRVQYEGPSVRTIMSALDVAESPADPFKLDLAIERTTDGFRVDSGTVSVGDDQLSFSGVLGNQPHISGSDINFELAGPNLAEILTEFGRDADELPYSPYRLAGRIERIPEYFVLHDVVAAIGDDLEYEFSADGTITDQPQLLGSRITIGTHGESIGAITDAAGIEGIPDVPFDVSATVGFVESGYTIENGRAQVADDSATVNGIVGAEPLSRDTSLDFEVSSTDLKSTLASYGVDIAELPSGELAASGTVRSQSESVALQNVVATFAGATANVNGNLGSLPGLNGIDLQFEVSGAELSRLLPPIDAVKGLDKPFSVAANVRMDEDSLVLNSVRIRVEQTRFTAELEVGLDPMLGKGRFVITGDSPDVLVLSPQFAEIATPQTAPLDLKAAGSWSDALWTVDQFDLSLGKGQLVINGSIDGPPSVDRTDLTFDWEISSLDNFSALAGRDLPDQPAHLKFHVVGTDDVISVDTIDALIGDSDINGSFSMRGGDIPTIALDLSSERLNLTPFLPPEPEQPVASQPPVEAPADKNRKVIPDTPIPVDLMRKIQASVSIRVAEIESRERRLSNFALVGSLVDGKMTVNEFGLKTTRGGELAGRAYVLSRESDAEVGFRLQGNNLGLGLPAYSEEELQQLPRYEVDIGMVTQGSTTRQMAADLNGYVRLVSGAGRLRASAMQMFTNDFLFQLLNTLNPFSAEDPYSNLNCVTVLAAIEDGQVAGKPVLVVQSDKLNIFANTQIDLKTESMDIDFNTVPQKGLGLSLSNLVNPYVKVVGTLGNPVLSLDPESALIQGGAAVATAGLSIIAIGLKDRFLSSKDPCGKAVADADEQFQVLRDKYAPKDAALQQ